MKGNDKAKINSRLLYICIIITTFLYSCISTQSVRNGTYKILKPHINYFTDKKSEKVNKPNQIVEDTNKTINNFENKSIIAGEYYNNQKLQNGLEDNEFLQQKIEKLENEIAYLRKEISMLYQLIEKENPEPSSNQNNNSSQNQREQETVEKDKNYNKNVSTQTTTKPKKTQISQKNKIKSPEKENVKEIEKIEKNRSLEQIVTLIKTKNYDEALRNIEIQLQSENEFNNLANLWYWKGEAFFYKKEYQTSLESFRKVLSFPHSPKRVESQIMIAECLTKLGKMAEAKKEYQKFVEEYPFSEYAPRAKRMLQQL